MKINNPEQAVIVMDQWREFSAAIQRQRLRGELDSLELGLMYYQQKENERGVQRCVETIALLRQRLEELAD